MTNQHPITPPPELVDQWYNACHKQDEPFTLYMTTQAARWGADQELEACGEWLVNSLSEDPQEVSQELRAARRPRPPSLKEQALDAWDRLRNEAWCEEIDFDLDFVRRALEALPE